MKNRTLLRGLAFTFCPYRLTVCCLLLSASSAAASNRPNVLWISCEDISPHLGCYGDANATTPNLDLLAEQGVRYTQAHHCHGVCAPNRTGIITGMWPTSLGVNHMRCQGRLPGRVKPFPYYLKRAGYYCVNNYKTDYNFHWQTDEVWHDSSKTAHWRNRPREDMPFFAVMNLKMTHEAHIWTLWNLNHQVVKDLPEQLHHAPAKMVVPPIYPQTDTSRGAMARLYNIITVMDRRVGELLKELEEDGLADDTVVFFWSDHGDGLPRAKRWVYDTGTRVPLIVRLPDRFRHDEQGSPGTVDDQLVSMIDLGPTVMNLAGIKVPEHVDGQPLLGKSVPPRRQYIYGARDRIDERYDLVRMVRDGRYRYMRNYMPWRPYLQVIEFAERNSIRKEMRHLHSEGSLTGPPAMFLQPTRPIDELYDTENDPFEVHNLAADAAYVDVLRRLRAVCDRWLDEHPDPMFLPEPILEAEEKRLGDRWEIGQSEAGRERLNQVRRVAELASRATIEDLDQLVQWLSSKDPAIRWWSAMALGNLAAEALPALSQMEALLQDDVPCVRVAAARALDRMGQTEAALPVLTRSLKNPSPAVRLWAIDVLDHMDDRAGPAIEAVREAVKDEDHYVVNVAKHALAELE